MAMEKFHYTTAAGDQVELPKFDQIPFGVVRKLRKEDEAEQVFGMFEALVERKLLTAKHMGVIDNLANAEIGDLMEEWQKDSETSVPESSAS